MANQKGQKIGFALGGLAGNNAHGAGFLQAALDIGAQPDFITCTSGQILWVHRYLEARVGETAPGDVLRERLQGDIDEIERFHQVDLDLFSLALYGKPGTFRAARYEYPLDLVKNATKRHAAPTCHSCCIGENEWREIEWSRPSGAERPRLAVVRTLIHNAPRKIYLVAGEMS